MNEGNTCFVNSLLQVYNIYLLLGTVLSQHIQIQYRDSALRKRPQRRQLITHHLTEQGHQKYTHPLKIRNQLRLVEHLSDGPA